MICLSYFARQTAAWLRAEANWESLSYMRLVSVLIKFNRVYIIDLCSLTFRIFNDVLNVWLPSIVANSVLLAGMLIVSKGSMQSR